MVRMLCTPKSIEAQFLKKVRNLEANDLQVLYEVFKLPDATVTGSSRDMVMPEVKVSGAKKQANLGGHPPPPPPQTPP